MSFYGDYGYDEGRFVSSVNRNFLCHICYNVLKDPVQCRRNEHHFCRRCITQHLGNNHTCPTCLDELTVETLGESQRIFKNYVNELKIRCGYVDRGCIAVIQLQYLERHEATCEFAPVYCSNEGCGYVLNRRNLIHHEREVCKFRELKCLSCAMTKMLEGMGKRMEKWKLESQEEEWKLKREKDKVECIRIRMKLKHEKAQLEFLVKEMKFERGKAEPPVKEVELKREIAKITEMELIAMKVEVQFQVEEVILFKLENGKAESTGKRLLLLQLKEIERELKSILEELNVNVKAYKKQLDLLTLEVKLNEMENDLVEINRKLEGAVDPKPAPQQERARGSKHVIVLGGRDEDGQSLTSIEGYIFREERWIELPPMNIPRFFMSSVVVHNEIIVSGGDTGATITDTIEILNLDETPLQWNISAVKLPVPLSGHQTVAYGGKLITIGGHDGNEGRNSDQIYEVLLTAPYTTRVLGSLPQPRAWHGAELVNDKIFIFGGGRNPAVPNDDVLVYDLSTNECSEKRQLPYRVQGMATVCLGNNVFLLGGVDETEQELNHAITYNIESEETATLPPMTQRRGGCCASIIPADDTVATCSSDTPTDILVALGSLQQLNTVEGYDFRSHAWRDMPSTREARELCTAVVSPVNFTFES